MTLPVPRRVRSGDGVRTQKGTQTNTVLTNGSGFNVWIQSRRRRMAGYNMPSTDAFPPGRMGLYSTVANVRFDHVRVWPDAGDGDDGGIRFSRRTLALGHAGLKRGSGGKP